MGAGCVALTPRKDGLEDAKGQGPNIGVTARRDGHPGGSSAGQSGRHLCADVGFDSSPSHDAVGSPLDFEGQG